MWADRVAMVRFLACSVVVAGFLTSPGVGRGQEQEKSPSAEALAELLRREPITLESWPAWRKRLLSWIGDRSRRLDSAYEAARVFCLGQADGAGELSAALAKDYLAWYFLGSGYLYDKSGQANPADSGVKAEKALRQCVQLEPGFSRGHRNLALALIYQHTGPGHDPKLIQAEAEFREARRLEPALPLVGYDGLLALMQNHYAEAETIFNKAMAEDPGNEGVAVYYAESIILNRDRRGSFAAPLQKLIQQFPNNGLLACKYGVALALDNDFRAAARELARARSLGTDPAKVLSPQLVQEVEKRGAPGWPERFGWIMLYFAGFYALVISTMAGVGLLLAGRTRGRRALTLLQDQPDHLVSEGQVVRAQGETLLARLYALALFAGLVFFYLSIPFIILGLLGTTALILYLIFLGGHIPIKLVIIIALVGLGMAWAVFKSLFTKPASGSFGVPKTAADCPRLHQVLQDVARRVDTDPVHEVFVTPGSAIGVHQEGRGPFGIFGVKRRVLTLGLSTMRFLTVGELQSILAHEYAHFSHRDTFYSRFIYQVHLSIEQALWGMGGGAGINYVNPFYWFLYLYYKCYSLLSAGFSRSRELLADRMASTLYGSDVFASALTKVSTDGMLFESTIYDNIAKLLEQQQAFVNMYDAFHKFRDEQLTKDERDQQYQKLLEEKGSLFAQHPTFVERIDAVRELPAAEKTDTSGALELFENPEETEKELTQFLTEYIYAVQQMQAEAAAQAAAQ